MLSDRRRSDQRAYHERQGAGKGGDRPNRPLSPEVLNPHLIWLNFRLPTGDVLATGEHEPVVDRDGARDATPAGALVSMVSMVIPDGPFGYDVTETFCHRVLFFASHKTGDKWIAAHEGTTLLPVDQAFEVGRVLTERVAPNMFGTKSGSR